MTTDPLKFSLAYAAQWCEGNGVKIPRNLSLRLRVYGVRATKDLSEYQDEIDKLVKDLYNKVITQSQFEVAMQDIIDRSLEDAWAEGAGDHADDEDMLILFAAIIERESNFIAGFAAAIAAGMTLDAALARAELWGNRWQDVKNAAAVQAGKRDGARMMWVYGDTQHCDTCAAANGVVATADEWDASQYHPQSGPDGILPNESLTCGGWRCGCVIQPTTDERNVPEGMTLDEYIESKI